MNDSIPFVVVARVGEIPAGAGRCFEVAGRLVAVFFDGGDYAAIDDLCPHMGASLSSGPLSPGGVRTAVVTCPWHAWRFRLHDGAWCDDERLKADVFAVRVVDGMIEVAVPPPASRAAPRAGPPGDGGREPDGPAPVSPAPPRP